METRTECVEKRAVCVETRTECVETRAECVETRTECMETRVECVETRVECVETRAVQDRRPKEVIVTTYPILVHTFYINFVRHKKIYKVKRDRSPVKGKKSIEIKNGLPTQGDDVLTPVHEECNPKVKSERRIGYSSPPIHKKRNPEVRITRGPRSGSKEKRGTVEVATPVTVKHREKTEAIRRRGDSATTGGRNANRRGNKAEPKSKQQATYEEARTVKHEEMTEAAVKEGGTASTARTNEIRKGNKAEPKSKPQAVNKKPGTTKHRESIETTKRGRGIASAVERNTKRRGSTEESKNKP